MFTPTGRQERHTALCSICREGQVFFSVSKSVAFFEAHQRRHLSEIKTAAASILVVFNPIADDDEALATLIDWRIICGTPTPKGGQ